MPFKSSLHFGLQLKMFIILSGIQAAFQVSSIAQLGIKGNKKRSNGQFSSEGRTPSTDAAQCDGVPGMRPGAFLARVFTFTNSTRLMPIYEMVCIAAHFPDYKHIHGLARQTALHIMDAGGVVRKIDSWGTRTLPQRMRRHGNYHEIGDYWTMHFDTAPGLSSVSTPSCDEILA
ncbi:hypothetical protein B0H17DRAFT_1127437 [Mycena rosella]|uniref:Uncharacterized protein n=1 Tax=Mycena rosella TaxID=1033263 RepID=A0AAD7GNN4_MYCRO|nr:hypothetical protein B0H17DRAFT_1127437 [Mycena rosella]